MSQSRSGAMGLYLDYIDCAALFFIWSSACNFIFAALNILTLFITVDSSYSPMLFFAIFIAGLVVSLITGLVRVYKDLPTPKAAHVVGWIGFFLLTDFFPPLTLCGFFVAWIINRQTSLRQALKFLIVLSGPYIILLVLIFLRVFIQVRLIPSESMSPTLEPNDRVVIETVSSMKHAPLKRGQIIVFEPPERVGEVTQDRFGEALGRITGLPAFPSPLAYIKRVIGIPGDKIEIRANDGVYVNGAKLDDKLFVSELPAYSMKTLKDIGGRKLGGSIVQPFTSTESVIVPPNTVFVLADNRNNSEDSHVFGFVDESRVAGRAWVMFNPQVWYMHDPYWHRPAETSQYH